MYLILWLSLQFEPVQETNLFLHWLHLLQQYKKGYMTVRHGLWLTKKKEITAYDFIQSCDIE